MVFNLCDIVRHYSDDGSAANLPLNFYPQGLLKPADLPEANIGLLADLAGISE
jgi:hypothetical protein